MGYNGNIFVAWKFRSMRHNAEENGAVWAKKKDKRVTRVGKWLRLLRIDEIPQLFNVFRGEMSLIYYIKNMIHRFRRPACQRLKRS